jgi:hypothetical protein
MIDRCFDSRMQLNVQLLSEGPSRNSTYGWPRGGWPRARGRRPRAARRAVAALIHPVVGKQPCAKFPTTPAWQQPW